MQQTAAPVQPVAAIGIQRSATNIVAVQRVSQHRSTTGCAAAPQVATQGNRLQQTTDRCNLLQRSHRSAANIAAALRAQSVAAHDHLLQRMTTCCSAAPPVATALPSVATDHSPLQPVAKAAQRNPFMAAVQRLPQRSGAIGCNTAARPRRRRLPGRLVHGVPSQSLARECNHALVPSPYGTPAAPAGPPPPVLQQTPPTRCFVFGWRCCRRGGRARAVQRRARRTDGGARCRCASCRGLPLHVRMHRYAYTYMYI